MLKGAMFLDTVIWGNHLCVPEGFHGGRPRDPFIGSTRASGLVWNTRLAVSVSWAFLLIDTELEERRVSYGPLFSFVRGREAKISFPAKFRFGGTTATTELRPL